MTPDDWAAMGGTVIGALGLLFTVFAWWHKHRPVRTKPPPKGPEPGPSGQQASEELTAQRRYKSRRLSLDPPTYESLSGRWRVTKLDRHDDPRFSAHRPCLLDRISNGQAFRVDFYASAEVALSVAAALDGKREMPGGAEPRGERDRAAPEGNAGLTTRGAYPSRRVGVDPPSYVSRNGRWRETKVARHDDPRFSVSRPWKLERLDGEHVELVDFYATSDLAFVVAAAMDGKQAMPTGCAPRPQSVAQE